MGKLKESESRSVVSDSLRPHGLYSPWNSPGQNTGVGSYYFFQGIFLTLGSNPRSPALLVDFLSAKPPGKPKNTEVGSLSFLQQIFLTQESNQGLLHCRIILYQLSYQGSLYLTQRPPVQLTHHSSLWTQSPCPHIPAPWPLLPLGLGRALQTAERGLSVPYQELGVRAASGF